MERQEGVPNARLLKAFFVATLKFVQSASISREPTHQVPEVPAIVLEGLIEL